MAMLPGDPNRPLRGGVDRRHGERVRFDRPQELDGQSLHPVAERELLGEPDHAAIAPSSHEAWGSAVSVASIKTHLLASGP